MNVLRLLALAALIPALSDASSAGVDQTSAPASPPVVQWTGANGGDASSSVQVIRTREDWAQLWRKLRRPVPRALNTARDMAVFISIGERPTGGFKPRVVVTAVVNSQLVITYDEGKPSRQGMVTQAFTQPWIVAIVRKTNLPVIIEPKR